MFFKNLNEKIDLIKEANRVENDINNLEIKLNGLYEEEKKSNRKLLNKKKKIDDLKSKFSLLKKTDKRLTSDIKSLETQIKEKNFRSFCAKKEME